MVETPDCGNWDWLALRKRRGAEGKETPRVLGDPSAEKDRESRYGLKGGLDEPRGGKRRACGGDGEKAGGGGPRDNLGLGKGLRCLGLSRGL